MKNWLHKAVTFTAAAGMVMSLSAVSYAKGNSNQHEVATHPIHIKNAATSTYQSGFTPTQIRTAYGINKLTQTGSGETIAIVDAYGSPTIQNDLNTFDKQFGLPSLTLNVVYPNGKPTTTDGGWALETAMDVEWAHAIAPSANIMVVGAKSASISDLMSAEQYAASHAQVVSNSWGGSEFSSESSYENLFSTPGVTFVASSGDNGSGASWPATSPNVVAVGGTTLKIDSSGNYQSESAWSGSGGADSSYFSRPAYQNNWQSVVGAERGFPDVAFDADPNSGVAVYSSTRDSGQAGWFQVGGTSLGSPSVSAIFALADQAHGSSFTGANVLTDIYSMAGTTNSTGYTTNFHDITAGSNGGYTAQSGYDLVTGIGSLKADQFVTNLASK